MNPPLAEAGLRRRNLLFLRAPRLWPVWPFLPVVRRLGGGEDYGVLYDALHAIGRPGYSATVFLTNLFCLPPSVEQFLGLPREVYDAPEEVYDAGWRID